ncbi:MAG: GTPase Era [Gemmatimonadota bacterium]
MPQTAPPDALDPLTRCGIIAVVGLPNAGKSTLLNRLVGEPLSIVTPKAQTTWRNVTGLVSRNAQQLILVDTPGLLAPRDPHQQGMEVEALSAMDDADGVLLILDSTGPPPGNDRLQRLERALAGVRAPITLVLNKTDSAGAGQIEALEVWAARFHPVAVHRISALRGDGVETLLEELLQGLPPGPFLYPADDLATQPVRFFVGEFIREAVFRRYKQEIPWATACQVEEFREGENPIYIHAVLYVEKESQKGILVGKGGTAIRDVGMEARQRIETFLEAPVYLDLRVKVMEGWKRKASRLRRLGLRAPDSDGGERGHD